MCKSDPIKTKGVRGIVGAAAIILGAGAMILGTAGCAGGLSLLAPEASVPPASAPITPPSPLDGGEEPASPTPTPAPTPTPIPTPAPTPTPAQFTVDNFPLEDNGDRCQVPGGVLPTGADTAAPVANDIVYFVGNSFTYGHDVPQMVGSILTSLGTQATIHSYTRGAYRLSNHLTDTGAASPRAFIEREQPAVVVLQEQSSLPIRGAGEFGIAAEEFARLVHSYGGRVLYFATWEVSGASTSALYNSYNSVAAATYGYIAPVGKAWERYLDEREMTRYSQAAFVPEVLYSSDYHHASVIGAYLAALVISSDIAGQSVVGASAAAGVTGAFGDDHAVDIAAVQGIASDICRADRLCGYQADIDSDGNFDSVDNCPYTANGGQKDSNNDGVGDACDPSYSSGVDSDGDGILNENDLCPMTITVDGGWTSTSATDADADGCRDADEDHDDDNDGLIEITTIEDLQGMRDAVTAASLAARAGCGYTAGCRGYELAGDLDFTAASSYAAGRVDSGFRSGTGWVPLPRWSELIFNGNNHTISNLYIRAAKPSAGLFSVVSGDGAVCNLQLDAVDVSGADYTGALAGRNVNAGTGRLGTIYNVGVNGGSVTGAQNVGGLTGYNSGFIVHSHSLARVESTHEPNSLGVTSFLYDHAYAGGLVGENAGTSDARFLDGIIRYSYAGGEVTARANMAGGLVGYMFFGTLEDSFAMGAVNAGIKDAGPVGNVSNAGGLVGESVASRIARVFSVGAVTAAGNYTGGAFGVRADTNPDPTFPRSGSVDDIYWNTQSSGLTIGNGTSSNPYSIQFDAQWPRPVTTADLSSPASSMFQNWSTVVWDFTNAASTGYPGIRKPTVAQN